MRALIVDDELYTREGILESIDWASFGIDEVMDADDGQTAMEIIGWFCPDIVISDIRMPRMDGISFAQSFLEKFPESKIIFMSAYMEIRYYRQAIRLSAVDYVEKPLDMEELEAAIKKAADAIRANQEKREDREKSRLLSEERLANYLITSRKNITNIMELCTRLSFPEEGVYICLCFYDLEREEDRQAVVLMIDGFFREEKIRCIAAPLERFLYCAVLEVKNRKRYRMDGLCGAFLNQYPSFRIGIGFYVENMNGIPESWKLARDGLNLAFYEPEKSIFEIQDLPKPVQNVQSGIYSRINEAIRREPENLPILLDTVFAGFEEKKALHPASVRTFAKAVMADMLKAEGTVKPAAEELFLGMDPDEYLDSCESLQEIHSVLRKEAERLTGSPENTGGMSPVIRNAFRYIRNHCGEQDLGMAKIADACGISVGYLCSVFKQETGMTTRQYIEDYRLTVAREKLANSEERIGDIAEECGFLQPGYFSRVFKQKTGMTPAEYRERYRP